MKWTSKITYVDRHTGEELRKEHITKGIYIEIRQASRTITKINDYANRINITIECERNAQQRLF